MATDRPLLSLGLPLFVAILAALALMLAAYQGEARHRHSVQERLADHLLQDVQQPLLYLLQRESERPPAELLAPVQAQSLRRFEEDPLISAWLLIDDHGLQSPHRRSGQEEAALLQQRGHAMAQRSHSALSWAAEALRLQWHEHLEQLPRVERIFPGEDPRHAGDMRLLSQDQQWALLRRVENQDGEAMLWVAVLDRPALLAQLRGSAQAHHPHITLKDSVGSGASVLAIQQLSPELQASGMRLPGLGLSWDWTGQSIDHFSGAQHFHQLWWIIAGLAILAIALVGWSLLQSRRQVLRERAFVAAASHELRTPAASLRALAENLYHGIVSEEPQRRNYYQALDSETRRLSGVVENILDQSRLERGVWQLRLQANCVLEVCQAAAQAAGLQAPDVHLDPQADRFLADPEALRRMCDNLLDNAHKYGGKTAVCLSATLKQQELHICVRDHGPGIPAAYVQRVQRPWGRAPGHDHRPGLGLGLHLVATLVRAHGGRLELRPGDPGLCACMVLLQQEATGE